MTKTKLQNLSGTAGKRTPELSGLLRAFSLIGCPLNRTGKVCFIVLKNQASHPAKLMTAFANRGSVSVVSRIGRRADQWKIVASSPSDLAKARMRYYDQLAAHFVEQIGLRRFQVILEAGCGRGQLTIPLLRRLPANVKMIAIDSSRGPYAGWLKELSQELRTAGLEKRVQPIKSDARRIRGVEDASVDIVVSNELLCDLPFDSQLEKALREFYRILRPGGFMIHGEWSSSPAAEPQAFLIKHWPSWTPDQLFAIMRKDGFHEFRVTYFATTIHFGYWNAVEELRTWGATETFLKRHEKMLKREGIELPFEHIVQCEK